MRAGGENLSFPNGQTEKAIETQNLRNELSRKCLKPELRQSRWSKGRAQKV